MSGPQCVAIAPDDVARPGGHYSHATRFGDLVFTSGQLGVRADGTHTFDQPFEDQARQVIGNMLAALRAAGAEPADILKVTVHIAGVDLWPRFNAVYAENHGRRPARANRGSRSRPALRVSGRNRCGRRLPVAAACTNLEVSRR